MRLRRKLKKIEKAVNEDIKNMKNVEIVNKGAIKEVEKKDEYKDTKDDDKEKTKPAQICSTLRYKKTDKIKRLAVDRDIVEQDEVEMIEEEASKEANLDSSVAATIIEGDDNERL